MIEHDCIKRPAIPDRRSDDGNKMERLINAMGT